MYLKLSERNYSTFDCELLAVHQAIRHFRHMLEGTPFIMQTDHRPQLSLSLPTRGLPDNNVIYLQ